VAPKLTITTITVGTNDVPHLARFYERLLGYVTDVDEGDWVILRAPDGGVALAVQHEEHHVPPTWPGRAGEQQMQLHLEIKVDDLDTAVAHALDCGATLASSQPQDDVRVCLDPAGHPFCLWVPT
jgi:catechol 2,3-dioxygenase-like lactoylglutathione lyase family enzyme